MPPFSYFFPLWESRLAFSWLWSPGWFPSPFTFPDLLNSCFGGYPIQKWLNIGLLSLLDKLLEKVLLVQNPESRIIIHRLFVNCEQFPHICHAHISCTFVDVDFVKFVWWTEIVYFLVCWIKLYIDIGGILDWSGECSFFRQQSRNITWSAAS